MWLNMASGVKLLDPNEQKNITEHTLIMEPLRGKFVDSFVSPLLPLKRSAALFLWMYSGDRSLLFPNTRRVNHSNSRRQTSSLCSSLKHTVFFERLEADWSPGKLFTAQKHYQPGVISNGWCCPNRWCVWHQMWDFEMSEMRGASRWRSVRWERRHWGI